MSAQIAAYGRLVADPRAIETRSGKAVTAVRLAASVECRDGAGETGEETLWLSVLAFGCVAEDLARHAKGEPVSVSGTSVTLPATVRNARLGKCSRMPWCRAGACSRGWPRRSGDFRLQIGQSWSYLLCG